ncbi:MAG: hypothetical protein MUO52_01905 [Desulfobacterales bacterium]|nr:hypothetical protein [Desulfobacterales bacterium]
MPNHVKVIIIRTLFILWALFSIPVLSLAAEKEKGTEQKEIIVIGTGRIEDGNIARAKETAIADALIRGMEVYLSRRLGSQGMISNFPRLVRDVIPRARETVENFHILAGEQTDGTYKVLVRLKINEKLMDERFRQIGVVLAGREPIKILFLVSQTEAPAGVIFYWWEDPEGHRALTPTEVVFHRIFEGYGFVPINRLLKVPEQTYGDGMKVLDLSQEAAINWGRIFSAEAVVHGKCEVIEGREVSVTLRALETADGSVIDLDREVVSVDPGPDGSKLVMQAMEKAINAIAARFTPAIIKAIRMPEARVTKIEITLKGFRNFKEFSDVKDFLEKEIQGVRSVKQTRVKADAMGISVEFSGTEEEFLDKIVRHPGMPVKADVTKAEGGELIFNIR